MSMYTTPTLTTELIRLVTLFLMTVKVKGTAWYRTVYWESLTEENIHEFRGFWKDCGCFLATIFYLSFILTKNMHGQ